MSTTGRAEMSADESLRFRGAEMVTLSVNADERGELVAFEEGWNLGFPLRRFFCIRVRDGHATRAAHSCSCHELVIALTGAVTVDLDNGSERERVRLSAGDRALWIQPGVWRRFRDFLPDTVLVAAASEPYSATHNWDSPQPQLIPSDGRE